MLMTRILGFFLIMIVASSPAVISQQTEQWELLRWPLRETTLELDLPSSDLEDAWHENRIYRHVQKDLLILEPKSDSLLEFLHLLTEHQPECVEADLSFGYAHLNPISIQYEPVLQFREPFSAQAELIVSSAGLSNENLLGVVSPDLVNGGGMQLNQLTDEGVADIEWKAFYSPRETIRQLLVGTINAAAVPEGYYELLLNELGRSTIIGRFHREKYDTQSMRVYWLRRDVYDNVFLRTVIIETWLRDRFVETLKRVQPNSKNEL